MSVRFKFRSSVGFDSVDLAGRPSISVRDLRARILEQKNLQLFRDFDLVISDADTGEAYEDEEFPIPEGSSVIIKRVPAASGINGAAGNNAIIKEAGFLDTLVSSPIENVAMDNFDDFGNDLYPALDATLSDSDSDAGNMNCIPNRKAYDIPRCLESPISICQNLDRSNLSEAMSKGNLLDDCDIVCNVEVMKQTKSNNKTEGHKKLDGAVDVSSPAMVNADLPTELRCSLCNTIFKEAVLIPCCQHSFCDKCIRLALAEKACCPKCSSTKCRVEDLLPNLSLRQAIEHFLEAQVPISGSDKVILRYAPDGESGIQAKEASCAVSIHQQDPTLPHSPSATGKGSNQVMVECAGESLIGNKRVTPGTGSRIIRLDVDKSVKSTTSLHKNKKLKGDGNDAPEDLKNVTSLQGGGNSLKLPQTLLQKEEANLATKKKKGLHANTAGAAGTVMPPSRFRKGDRNCYMCGSPDHLVRDCPVASSSYPMLQTGDATFHGGMPAYGPPYWHGSPFPYMRPYVNMYGTPGMLPFDPTISPVSPFGVPSYMPSLYAGLPLSCGLMRMGGVAPPMVSGAERPLSHAEFMEFQDSERKHKNLNEHLEREDDDDFVEDYHYHDSRRRSHDHKPQLDKDATRIYSDDENPRLHMKHSHDKHLYVSSHQRPRFSSDDEEIHSVDRKHDKVSRFSVSGRDHRLHYSEKSNSDIHDASDSSIQHSRQRNKHRYRSSSKKYNEKSGQCGSDCSRKSHHRSQWEMSCDREGDVTDHKKHSRKHHNHPESASMPDSSSDQRQHEEKESSHSSRHSKHRLKSSDNQLGDDRWEMVDGLDEVYGAEHHYHRHRRTH